MLMTSQIVDIIPILEIEKNGKQKYESAYSGSFAWWIVGRSSLQPF